MTNKEKLDTQIKEYNRVAEALQKLAVQTSQLEQLRLKYLGVIEFLQKEIEVEDSAKDAKEIPA